MRWTRGRETQAGLVLAAGNTYNMWGSPSDPNRVVIHIDIDAGSYTSGEFKLGAAETNIGAVTVLSNDSDSAFRNAINAGTATHGVTATLTTVGGGTFLALESGGDIIIAGTDPGSDVLVGLTPVNYKETVLDYDGSDMHHKVYMSAVTGAPVATLEGSVDKAVWFEIDTGTVGTGTGTVSVLVTGNLQDIPFKYVRLKVATADINVAVDSFGTMVR